MTNVVVNKNPAPLPKVVVSNSPYGPGLPQKGFVGPIMPRGAPVEPQVRVVPSPATPSVVVGPPAPTPQVLPPQSEKVGQTGKKSLKEFTDAIKQIHPEYASADPMKLGLAMIQKFPQYADKVDLHSGVKDLINSPKPAERSKGLLFLDEVANLTGLGENSFAQIPNTPKDLAVGIGKPLASVGVSIGRQVQSLPATLRGEHDESVRIQEKPVNLPLFGKTNTIQGNTPLQNVGLAAQIGSNIVGVGKGGTLPSVLNSQVGRASLTGATQGALQNTGSYLENEANPTFTGASIAAGKGALTGFGAGAVAAKVAPIITGKGGFQESRFNQSIKEGVDKGIKPTVVGKKTLAGRQEFYDNTKSAVQSISENRGKLNILDANGEIIDKPKTVAQFAQAVDQTKSEIYKQYNELTKSATGKDAQVKVDNTLQNLNTIAGDLKYSPEVRAYAKRIMPDIQELQNASPEIIEARIADYNKSLQNYYRNPTKASQMEAQVDGSVAQDLRRILDQKITETEGPGYAELKKKYGALKAVEAEVNKRALVEARKNVKGLADLTDIFTGGEILSGILTLNPVPVAKGLFGMATKKVYQHLNSPDRYIAKMFDQGFKAFPDTIPTKNSFTQDLMKGMSDTNVGLSTKDVPRVDKLTQQEMLDVIDYVEMKKPYNQQMENSARDLADKYIGERGAVVPKSLQILANRFKGIIERQSKNETPIYKKSLGQNVGAMIGAGLFAGAAKYGMSEKKR